MNVERDTLFANDEGYSLENAIRFGWSSISGNLNPERVAHLKNHILGDRVLDAGCGGGAYVDFLSRQGFDAVGVDKFGEFLRVASEHQFEGEFIQGDVSDLPFEDKSFDSAFCFDVLEHVDDVIALQELSRVTRQRIIIAVPKSAEEMEKAGLVFGPYRDMTHLRYYSEESLAKLIGQICPKNFEIFGELAVNFPLVVKSFLKSEHHSLPVASLQVIDKKSLFRKMFLSRIVQMPAVREAFQLVYEQLDSYQTVYTGLVAVIDL